MHRLRNIAFLCGLIGLVGSSALAAELAPIKQEASTVRYRLELQIGPTEKMFTAAEVAAKHPTEAR